MTCLTLGNAIICFTPTARLKVNGRYVWLDFHEFCGPTFYTDRAHTIVYDPVDENDPVWPVFEQWLERRNRQKQAQIDE